MPLDLSGRESRIANRTIPRIAGLGSPEIPQRETISESNRNKAEIEKNQFRIAIRIASYQCLKQPWNRAILHRSILDSESRSGATKLLMTVEGDLENALTSLNKHLDVLKAILALRS